MTTIENCRLIQLPIFEDNRGTLTVCEKQFKRIFWVTNLSGSRGNHAHKNCNHLLVCISGSCIVTLDDGKDRKDFFLDKPNVGLMFPSLIWNIQHSFSDNAELLVFATCSFDKSEYITDYQKFIKLKGSKMEKRVVFYVLNQQQYLDEAEQSVKSLKVAMPDIPAHLFYFGSGKPAKIFDEVHLLDFDEARPWYSNSITGFNKAAEVLQDYKMIYLDSDTYVCAPFYEVFRYLDRFEFMSIHSSGRITTKTVLDVEFPEYHIGLIGIKNSDKIKRLFADWQQLYDDHYHLYGNNDQGPLRDAIWRMPELNTYILPPEYCFRFPFGGFLGMEVKTLHGRPKNFAAIAQRVNEEKRKMRTFDKKAFRGL